jgi:hypothetical protein
MAQIFHRSTNTISRVSIYGAVIFVAILGYAANVVNSTAYITDVNVARPQPVPFSHKHHVGELGLDCRYCHTSVEVSSSAGMPFANLDECGDPGTRAGELSRFDPDRLDACERAPRLRLFQSQHSYFKGGWVHYLPRACRRNEHHLARAESLYALVPRMPQRPREIFAAKV